MFYSFREGWRSRPVNFFPNNQYQEMCFSVDHVTTGGKKSSFGHNTHCTFPYQPALFSIWWSSSCIQVLSSLKQGSNRMVCFYFIKIYMLPTSRILLTCLYKTDLNLKSFSLFSIKHNVFIFNIKALMLKQVILTRNFTHCKISHLMQYGYLNIICL